MDSPIVARDLSNSASILLSCSILAMILSISVAIAPPSLVVIVGRAGEDLPSPPRPPPMPLEAVVVVNTPDERELKDVTPVVRTV